MSQKVEIELLKTDMGAKFENLFEMQLEKTSILEKLQTVEQRMQNYDDLLANVYNIIDAIYNENRNLQAQLNHLEQKNLVNSVICFGLPRLQNDQAMTTLSMIATNMGLKLDKGDMKEVYIMNQRDNATSHIIGKFYDERKRDEFLSMMKNRITNNKPLLVEEVCALPNDSRLRGTEIRIRTVLTKETRKLLAMAMQFSHQFEFIWECDGRVLMKENKESKTVEIKSESHLYELTQRQHWSQKNN